MKCRIGKAAWVLTEANLSEPPPLRGNEDKGLQGRGIVGAFVWSGNVGNQSVQLVALRALYPGHYRIPSSSEDGRLNPCVKHSLWHYESHPEHEQDMTADNTLPNGAPFDHEITEVQVLLPYRVCAR